MQVLAIHLFVYRLVIQASGILCAVHIALRAVQHHQRLFYLLMDVNKQTKVDHLFLLLCWCSVRYYCTIMTILADGDNNNNNNERYCNELTKWCWWSHALMDTQPTNRQTVPVNELVSCTNGRAFTRSHDRTVTRSANKLVLLILIVVTLSCIFQRLKSRETLLERRHELKSASINVLSFWLQASLHILQRVSASVL